jgi:hypothetical protein
MTTNRSLRTAFVVCAVAAASSAQVAFEWAKGFAQPGVPGRVLSSALHDFGAGPEVCVVSQLPNACLVLHYDGDGWRPVGPVLDGIIEDLRSFDSGSGPELYGCGSLSSSSASLGPVFRWNGTQWQSASLPTGSAVAALTVFDFGSGPRLVAYTSGNGLWTWDGLTWAVVPGSDAMPAPSVQAFAAFDDGTGLRLHAAAGNEVRKWTGAAWQVVGTANDTVNALAVFDDGFGARLYAGGSFTQMAGSPAAAVARWNGGASWSALGSGLTLVGQPGAATVFDLLAVQTPSPALLVAGGFTHAGGTPAGPLASWSGTAWTAAAASYQTVEAYPTVHTVQKTGAPGTEDLYIGGNFSKIDGTPAAFVARRGAASAAWGPVPASSGAPPGATITAAAEFDAGSGPDLIVAGFFDTIGGVAAKGIARWDGTSWFPLGAGFINGGEVTCMTSWDDGTGPGLYVGGSFTSVGGVACNNIAKWNGSAWSPLGSGCAGTTSPAVRAIFPLPASFPGPTPRLLVGGTMLVAGGVSVAGIAAWDGSTWSAVGNANLGFVFALELFDHGFGPLLYAAGIGGVSGGLPGYGFQRFDGVSWSLIPGWTQPGSQNSNQALETFDDGAGNALFMGTTSPPALVKYDGTSFSLVAVMSSSLFANPSIRTLVRFDEGDGPGLYFGGQFLTVAGQPAAGIARYRGGAFSVPGGGVGTITVPFAGATFPASIRTLAAHDDGSGPALFAGGSFTKTGSVLSSGIARWGAGAPVIDLVQPGGPGSSTSIQCTNLQPGREYFNIGSMEACGGGPGTGIYLGLCASDPAPLILQASVPLESPPFHFLAAGTSRSFGPYDLLTGLTVEAITLDVTGGRLWRVSAVESIVIQ